MISTRGFRSMNHIGELGGSETDSGTACAGAQGSSTYELLRMNLLMLAVTASPVNELATILFCGTTDQPTPICCQAARDARNQMDKRGRAIIDRYLARNCDKEKDRRP